MVNIIGMGLGPTAVAMLTDDVFKDKLKVNDSLAIVGGVAQAAAAVLLFGGLKSYRRSLEYLKEWTDIDFHIDSEGQMSKTKLVRFLAISRTLVKEIKVRISAGPERGQSWAVNMPELVRLVLGDISEALDHARQSPAGRMGRRGHSTTCSRASE